MFIAFERRQNLTVWRWFFINTSAFKKPTYSLCLFDDEFGLEDEFGDEMDEFLEEDERP